MRIAAWWSRTGLTTHRLLVAVLFIAIAAMAVRQPADTDTWWHLKSGQLMWETGKILRTDPFSHTVAGQPWIDHGWLVQLVLWPIYHTLGLQGLSLLLAAIVVLGFALVYAQCDGRPYLAALVTLLAAVASSVIWSIRPQIFSFLLTAVIAFLLYRYKQSHLGHWLWPVPLLVALWVNVHGGFVLVFILLACYLAGETMNRLTACGPKTSSAPLGPMVLVALVSIPAVFLNPNGSTMLAYAFQTVRIPALQDYILEWAAPDFHNLQLHPFIWLLLLTLAAMGLSRRRADWTDLALVGAFSYMSLLAVRNVAVFALVAAPVLSRYAVSALEELALAPRCSWLTDLTRSVTRAPTRPSLILLNLFLLTLVVAGAGLKVGLDLMQMDKPEIWGQGLPVAAVEWLRQHKLPGQMFNTYNWGGYLIWSLYPEEPVFVDGRTDLYSFNSRVLEDYVTVHWAHPGWENVLDRYEIGFVLTENTGLTDAVLAKNAAWERIYADEQAVIYRRWSVGTSP